MPGTRGPRCDAPYVEIIVTLNGVEATMQSCSTCDSRVWTRGGEPVDLEGVLADLHVERRT